MVVEADLVPLHDLSSPCIGLSTLFLEEVQCTTVPSSSTRSRRFRPRIWQRRVSSLVVVHGVSMITENHKSMSQRVKYSEVRITLQDGFECKEFVEYVRGICDFWFLVVDQNLELRAMCRNGFRGIVSEVVHLQSCEER